jgi:lysophospholipase L1-like esterase
VALKERQEIVAKLAQKYNAVFVRLQPVFDEACKRAPAENWIWDGIHPTFAGQQLLADQGVRTVNLAFANPLEDPLQNSAIAPVVNFERDSYDWLHRHDDVLDLQKMGNPDVVMIGDSITHFWSGMPKSSRASGPLAWEKAFHGLRVINMGFGWDRTQNVLWRLQHGEFEGLSPKTVVLNIGTNNLVGDATARTNTPEETAAGILAVASLVHERAPAARIYVMGVFPRGFDKGNELDARIQRLNHILATKLKELPFVTFLDIRDKLCEPDGSITKETFLDGTHPTERGYRIWARALKEAGAIPAG